VSRRVLITAGANGIGLVMARAFASLGRPGLGDGRGSGRSCLAAACGAGDGLRCRQRGGDGPLFAEVARDWGGLDVAIANAGIKGPTATIEDMPLEGWHQCLGVNLDGAMLCARGAARLMKPAGKGVITFISSTSGLYGTPFRAPYVAAKWGVIGLMKTVAMELGPHGIRANAICPGSVNGPRIDRVIEAEAVAKGMTPDAVRQGYASGTALKRLADPEDVADMAVYLASDGARMVSGQALAVDGMTYNVDP
jgi:NAD(P)-dependent dehydrogenase (short-subunit alcohol dehydrogenase family)